MTIYCGQTGNGMKTIPITKPSKFSESFSRRIPLFANFEISEKRIAESCSVRLLLGRLVCVVVVVAHQEAKEKGSVPRNSIGLMTTIRSLSDLGPIFFWCSGRCRQHVIVTLTN